MREKFEATLVVVMFKKRALFELFCSTIDTSQKILLREWNGPLDTFTLAVAARQYATAAPL